MRLVLAETFWGLVVLEDWSRGGQLEREGTAVGWQLTVLIHYRAQVRLGVVYGPGLMTERVRERACSCRLPCMAQSAARYPA